MTELEECIPDPDNGDRGELIRLINEFLAKQSKTDRVIFVQRYWYSLSTAQIAKETELSENAVWIRLHRTRDRLKTFLEERGYRI
jgi:RNA polymerase sigma-70 factor (ECF subfamily)